jgi:hypothetical protein
MMMKQATRVSALAFACTALLIIACSESSTGPTQQPGQLTVSVSTSGSGGAAFLVTVTGNGITNPAAANSGHQFYQVASNNTLTAVVISPSAITSGALFRFSVPDVNQAASYDVDLVQVAGTDNALLTASAFDVDVSN